MIVNYVQELECNQAAKCLEGKESNQAAATCLKGKESNQAGSGGVDQAGGGTVTWLEGG